eukprot:SM000013S26535  [mRNA]  locus=s13:927895:928992:+ [translate_table: standard]
MQARAHAVRVAAARPQTARMLHEKLVAREVPATAAARIVADLQRRLFCSKEILDGTLVQWPSERPRVRRAVCAGAMARPQLGPPARTAGKTPSKWPPPQRSLVCWRRSSLPQERPPTSLDQKRAPLAAIAQRATRPCPPLICTPRGAAQELRRKGVAPEDTEEALRRVFHNEETAELPAAAAAHGDRHAEGVGGGKEDDNDEDLDTSANPEGMPGPTWRKLVHDASRHWLTTARAPNLEARRRRMIAWLQRRGYRWHTVSTLLSILQRRCDESST